MVTFEEYQADKLRFNSHDAYYDREETSMEGEDFYTSGVTYKKRQSFWTEEQNTWGTWVESHTIRYEPILEVISSVKAGPGMYSQVAKQIGHKVIEDLEYFVYGEGLAISSDSKYIHKMYDVMYGEVA